MMTIYKISAKSENNHKNKELLLDFLDEMIFDPKHTVKKTNFRLKVGKIH